MASKKLEKVILGSLMRNPLLLSQTEKYTLSIDDFDDKLTQHIFYAIASIAQNGSTKVKVQDVHVFLQTSPTGLALFDTNNGVALLNDAIELANEESFSTYYNLFKKENLLRDLKRMGFDTKEFYEFNPITKEEVQINDKYNNLELQDIIEAGKMKLLNIEGNYLKNDASETQDVFEGVEDLLQELEENPDIGVPIQGDIFNTAVAGARKGAFYVRSGSSGVSKTRQAIGDACYLAFPIRYNQRKACWEQVGCNERTLVIVTEQSFKEIRTMILAYLTGFNEKKIKRPKTLTPEERVVVMQATYVLEKFRDNMYIVRMPNPSIQVVKTIVRENVLLHDIGYVFYDYIFVGPSLLNEFKGFNLRNDEVLLMFSTALKDLAVELEVFVMSSTQVNASADDNKNIRNEGSIAGARSIINKADVGCIMARPTNEELQQLKSLIEETGILEPNVVTDIYKNRGDEWTQVRVWTNVDMGNLRKRDLFITNSRLEAIDEFHVDAIHYEVPADAIACHLYNLNKKG